MTAADLILKKALAASDIGSREWSYIHAGLRDRAFFVSRVEDVRILSETQRLVSAVTRQNLDPSVFRREMRKALEAAGWTPKPGEEGTIKDLFTKRRLDLIYRTNRDQARGFVQYKMFTTKAALEEFPAQRLVRVQHRNQPRDWDAKWMSAAQSVGWEGVFRGSDKVALKTSPIWTEISRFGHPYPPFDFGSGMGVENVSMDECVKMGFIKPDDPPQKVPEVHFNDGLAESIPDLRNDSLCGRILHRDFGDQIVIENSKVKWQGNLIKDVLSGKVKKAKLGRGYNGENLSLSHQFFVEHGSKHLDPNEPYEHLVPGEFELLPTLWRSPSRVLPTRDPNRTQLELDTLDGGSIVAIVDKRNGFKSVQKRISPGGSVT